MLLLQVQGIKFIYLFMRSFFISIWGNGWDLNGYRFVPIHSLTWYISAPSSLADLAISLQCCQCSRKLGLKLLEPWLKAA